MEFVFIDEIFLFFFEWMFFLGLNSVRDYLMSVNSKGVSFRPVLTEKYYLKNHQKQAKLLENMCNWPHIPVTYQLVCGMKWLCILQSISNPKCSLSSMVLQVYVCIGILVAVWYQLKFGSKLLFQLLCWFHFLFFRVDAVWQKTEGE